MQKSLKEKFLDLKKGNFTEQATLEFFGNLNENDINVMLAELDKESFAFLRPDQRSFMKKYLEKILEKIEEKKRTG